MNKLQALKFYFVEMKGVNISALVILILALGFFTFSMLNVPGGKESILSGTVVGVGITHGSSIDLAYQSINVKLNNGTVVHLAIPREAVVFKGDTVQLKKESLLFSGTKYSYHGQAKKP